MAPHEADQQLIEEFAAAPTGPHGRPLRELLNRFRSAPNAGKYCLLVREPHRLYQLARMVAGRGGAPVAVEGVFFTSVDDAEVEVLKLRLKELRDGGTCR